MFHDLWLVLRVVIAVVAAVLIYLFAAKTIANFSRSDPPPDPSEPSAGVLTP